MEDRKFYTASQIAKYLIKKSKTEDKLTNLKLQKILYYAQGWYLANRGKLLFSDEIEAWKYGPAIRSVYQEYKGNGMTIINPAVVDTSEADTIDPDTKKFLDKLWGVYKAYSGSDLILMTHNELPYIQARKGLQSGDSSSAIISVNEMLNSFRKRIENNGTLTGNQ